MIKNPHMPNHFSWRDPAPDPLMQLPEDEAIKKAKDFLSQADRFWNDAQYDKSLLFAKTSLFLKTKTPSIDPDDIIQTRLMVEKAEKHLLISSQSK
ncbi:hypothetical protein JW926_06175 [Candidatus Sumerlaeota bacterium]|nr:hypothetical protein [Candidatus Sumerlaeota bacterium]